MTRIAVLGSTNMDLVAYVKTAPRRGETVTGHEFRTIPGGKGANQAVAAARAGADVALIGAVGTDEFGARLRAALDGSGVDTDLVRTTEGPSGTAHIVVDAHGGNAIVVIPGANASVTHLGPGDEALISGAESLLLQLELPMDTVVEGAKAARRHGVRTVLTPSPYSPCRPNSSPPPTCWWPTSTRPPRSPASTTRRRQPARCSNSSPRSWSRSAPGAACTRRAARTRSRSRPRR